MVGADVVISYSYPYLTFDYQEKSKPKLISDQSQNGFGWIVQIFLSCLIHTTVHQYLSLSHTFYDWMNYFESVTSISHFEYLPERIVVTTLHGFRISPPPSLNYKGQFFVGIHTTSQCETFHSHVAKYVNVRTNLIDFVEQQI